MILHWRMNKKFSFSKTMYICVIYLELCFYISICTICNARSVWHSFSDARRRDWRKKSRCIFGAKYTLRSVALYCRKSRVPHTEGCCCRQLAFRAKSWFNNLSTQSLELLEPLNQIIPRRVVIYFFMLFIIMAPLLVIWNFGNNY